MKKIVIIALILISGKLYAQSTPEEIVQDFFITYMKDPGKAIKQLYATNKWNDRIKDDVDKIIGTVNSFTKSYMGEYYGYEIITTKKLSESFETHTYLVKYERQPIRFTFKFYKPNDKWVLFSYAFDDNMSN